jgi:hypothetical protein
MDPNGLALDAFLLDRDAIRYERLPRPTPRTVGGR